jgi:hypothetical protein
MPSVEVTPDQYIVKQSTGYFKKKEESPKNDPDVRYETQVMAEKEEFNKYHRDKSSQKVKQFFPTPNPPSNFRLDVGGSNERKTSQSPEQFSRFRPATAQMQRPV